ncbi:MAG TPA: sugar ABC transporter ATP-binding protein [Jatrophihabitantaceae bacterium]|nr:sugar ABC transporter ATP-binding protein [Jatrophihabitantaceae bacterium]
MTASAEVAVELNGVAKIYGPVRVLNVEELALLSGQVVALVGENGAGKSTLMGSLAGTVKPDLGRIRIAGTDVPLGSPAASAAAGVAMVSQEFPLVGQMSVGENLFLGTPPPGTRAGLVNFAAMHRAAQQLLDELGLDIASRQRLDSLSVAQRQLIEIAKAWRRSPLLLILDEPTSALGPVEAGLVLSLARKHAAAGGVVLFVGHRLDEVLDVCDRIVVLRNGEKVADLPREGATEQLLIKHMVGAELSGEHAAHPDQTGPVVLQAAGLTADGLGPLDLQVRAGEIVGVAGLMGSGRSRLLHTIFGAQPATGGSMELGGRPYRPRSAKSGVDAGITLVAEDRKQQSLLPDAPIRWNVSLTLLPKLARFGYLKPRRERAMAGQVVAEYRVRCQSAEQPIRALSGGNQQRAVFARAMATSPRLLLLDEPTRGVDVGAKAEIYRLIEEATAAGTAVLVASSELEELMHLCSRIVVLAHGRAAATFDRPQFSKEAIIGAAAASPSTQPERAHLITEGVR